MLSEAAPTVKEILDAVKSKSNGAAPGIDSISYVPYKRCPCLLPILVQLFAKDLVLERNPCRLGNRMHPTASEVCKNVRASRVPPDRSHEHNWEDLLRSDRKAP